MKHKMYDVGKKSEPMEVGKPEKNKKHYPSMYLTDKALPCLKGMKVGDKLSLMIMTEITGTSKRDNNPTEYTLEVHKAGEESEMRMSKAMEEATEEHTKKEE